MKMECPFKGCDGVIDITRDINKDCIERSDGKPEQIHWVIHTIICPKCHNPVAHFNIMPECWVTTFPVTKNQKHTINIPGKKESVSWMRDPEKHELNPYLKKWAHFDKPKKRRRKA